jgi:hypothetical protein
MEVESALSLGTGANMPLVVIKDHTMLVSLIGDSFNVVAQSNNGILPSSNICHRLKVLHVSVSFFYPSQA